MKAWKEKYSAICDHLLLSKNGRSIIELELVDIYLWVFKRLMEEIELTPEIYPLLKKQMYKSRTDEISINAIAPRWQKWFEDLPEPTEEQLEKGREIMAMDE